jgi:VWFA-related protein
VTDENVQVFKKLNRTAVSGETSDALRYKNRRLLAFYFDMSAMAPADQFRALAAAEKFVRTQITADDMVAVLRYAGGTVDVLQDFTADRNRLLSILETLTVGEDQGGQNSIQDASSADTGAAFGQDDSEFNVFNTDRQLSALQTAATMLGRLNEKKALLYFASGLRLNGTDNQAQLHATVDAAVRAGVSFWPIDARGLVAEIPMGDATQGSPGNQGMYSGTAAEAGQSGFQRSQDTLFALAGDTGGKALLDNNDLTRGITQAQASIGDYYILSYSSANAALDGKFRRIKVAVNRPDAKLDYRQGYYAGKEFARFTSVDKERQLEDALMLDDPITELTVALEINYFQLNRAEYYVPIMVKIPGRELALAKKGGAEHTLIDFVGEIKDAYGGSTVTNLRDDVNIKLTDATAAELAHRPIEYSAGFTLLPGKYLLKLLARDDETGRIGTYQASFTIPNLNKVTDQVAISSVVLSGQRVDMREALYNAQKGKQQAKNTAADPLIVNGAKLIPSVTRVFSRSRPLYVYLQGYEIAASTPRPLMTYVSFYSGGKLIDTVQPVSTAPANTDRLTAVPFSFTLPLDKLQPGQYDCQVTVLDPNEGKSTFWRASVQLTP